MLWVCIIRPSSAALSGRCPMVRWRHSMIARDRARSRRSPLRPRHGWCRWPAARRRNWAIRTNCGRRGCWLVMRVSTDRRKGTAASPSWCKARCARYSTSKRESRDPEFKAKMAEVLCIYREVKIIKETAAAAKQKPSDAAAIVSYDEKPGIQAIATTAPDLSPEPGLHATFARDHEYKRNGTVSLLAGIDLLTGKVHALVRDRHRSRDFIEFLKLIDAAYPTHTAIKLILDNRSE